MVKKILARLLSVCVVFAALTASAAADEQTPLMEIARMLPPDTLAFVSLHDMAPVLREVEESGFFGQLSEEIEDDAGKELLNALIEFVPHVRSLHLALWWIGDDDEPQILLAAETPSDGVPERLRSMLENRIERADNDADAEIYRFRSGNGTPLPLLERSENLIVAFHENLIFLGNDTERLLWTLAVAADENTETLAGSDDYLSAAAHRREDSSAFGYASVTQCIRAYEKDMSGWGLENFRTGTAALGMDNVRMCTLTVDSDIDGALLTLFVDDESRGLYSLLSGNRGVKELARYVPADAVFFASLSISDAAAGWNSLKDHLFDIGSRMGEFENRQMFDEFIGEVDAEMQQELGVGFDDIAGLIGREAGFFVHPEAEEVVALVSVTDPGRSHAFLTILFDAIVGDVSSRMHKDIEIHSARDRWSHFAWAGIDGVMAISFKGDGAVEAVIDASEGENQLAAARLPRENTLQMHVNVHSIISEEFGEDNLSELPQTVRDWLADLTAAAALDAGEGTITLQLVLSEPPPAGMIASMVHTAAETRKRAKKVACANNLRQIGLSLAMYEHLHGGRLPTGATSGEVFRALVEAEVLQNLQLLSCPSNPLDVIDFGDPEGISYYLDPTAPARRHPMRAIAAERPPWDLNHGDGVNVLFEDRHVLFIRPGDSGPPDRISNPYLPEDTDIYAETGDPATHAWIRWDADPE